MNLQHLFNKIRSINLGTEEAISMNTNKELIYNPDARHFYKLTDKCLKTFQPIHNCSVKTRDKVILRLF